MGEGSWRPIHCLGAWQWGLEKHSWGWFGLLAQVELGSGLPAANQVVWRPAKDMAVRVGLGLAGLCQSTGSQLGHPWRALLLGWTWLGGLWSDESPGLWPCNGAKLASLCSVLISKICDRWEIPLGPSELVHNLGMEGCGASGPFLVGPFCYSQDPTWHLLLCLLLGGSVAQEA